MASKNGLPSDHLQNAINAITRDRLMFGSVSVQKRLVRFGIDGYTEPNFIFSFIFQDTKFHLLVIHFFSIVLT